MNLTHSTQEAILTAMWFGWERSYFSGIRIYKPENNFLQAYKLSSEALTEFATHITLCARVYWIVKNICCIGVFN